ncbi:MAG: UvrB/UvrC motif-containing protein [Thermoanaerobacteraceae bacterium]|nr:UvrB/UvrC motif-containing protein [Thermoanaerobacteraceae bacterium]
MLCERCQQKPASVHFTQIVNNQKTELNLCPDCARELENQWSFSLPKFFASLLNYEPGLGLTVDRAPTQCGECGLTFAQFQQGGLLGCPECYHTFESRLDPLLRRLHGSTQHRGKVPRRAGGNLRIQREIDKLRRELQELVAQEAFERAAEVRDRIRQLEAQVER